MNDWHPGMDEAQIKEEKKKLRELRKARREATQKEYDYRLSMVMNKWSTLNEAGITPKEFKIPKRVTEGSINRITKYEKYLDNELSDIANADDDIDYTEWLAKYIEDVRDNTISVDVVFGHGGPGPWYEKSDSVDDLKHSNESSITYELDSAIAKSDRKTVSENIKKNMNIIKDYVNQYILAMYIEGYAEWSFTGKDSAAASRDSLLTMIGDLFTGA